MKLIIGLVGSFGSGCTFIAEKFLSDKGYKYLSLAKILREEFKEKFNRECNLTRHEMQEFGNTIRKEKGSDYLAQKALEIIKANVDEKWIIDSIRNPEEIKFFKTETSSFYVFAISADINTRWERVKNKYNEDRKLFTEDDNVDSNDSFPYGQRVKDCFELADIIISNNSLIYQENNAYEQLKLKIDKYIGIIERSKFFKPNEMETLMAMAYANSLRSSCEKRKVGAVIIDDYGNAFSSGYNEVPKDELPCKQAWGICYRDKLKGDFSSKIQTIIEQENVRKDVYDCFKNSFKILDYCRALHAEENAILNVTRSGGSVAFIRGATLYTTTYPCNLCANKIVQVGISNIVYLEPYPMGEAKRILETNKVNQIPFEGVTFNAYFRLRSELT